jgi:hypothetical protein
MYYINPKKVKPFWKGLGFATAMLSIANVVFLFTGVLPNVVLFSLLGLSYVCLIIVVTMMIIQGAENRS